MVYMLCKDCRIAYSSPCLAVGDEYVPQRQNCPKCGKECEQTDIIYHADDQNELLRQKCARRQGLLNIIKAKYTNLYELADWTGQVPLVKDWAWALHEFIRTAVYDIEKTDKVRKTEDG